MNALSAGLLVSSSNRMEAIRSARVHAEPHSVGFVADRKHLELISPSPPAPRSRVCEVGCVFAGCPPSSVTNPLRLENHAWRVVWSEAAGQVREAMRQPAGSDDRFKRALPEMRKTALAQKTDE
jgi:hypothetical protein